MSDIDDELAALEKEVENEDRMANKIKGGKQSIKSNNKNMNYGNNNAPNQSNKINYEDFGDNSNGLEDFLNDNNNYNNYGNQGNNYNYNNNNYGNQGKNYNNNYNQYGNQGNNYNNNYNQYGNNYNNYNNNINSNNRNNNYNNNYNNNNYNNFNNNNYNNNNYNNFNNNNYNNNNYNNNNNNYNNRNNNNNFNNNYNNNKMNNNQNQQMNNRQNMGNISQNSNNTKRQSINQNQNQNNKNQYQSKQNSKYSAQPQQPQRQSQQHPKQSQYPEKKQSKNLEITNEPEEDIYPEKQEGMYHKVKEMKSLTVLEEEIALCNKIIAFKKKKGLDYDEWETKKDMAELQLNNTKTSIENGLMDFEGYKKLILGELQYEKKILKFTEMDKKSKPNELKEIKRRIEQRIEVISKELTQNVDEDNGEAEEEKTENTEQKNEPNKQQNQTKTQIINNNNYNLGPQDTAESDEPKKTEIKQPIHHQYQNPQNQIQPKTQVQQQKPQQPQQPQQPKKQIKVPPQYIIQQKVLVTDPKTGKQMYVIKNVIDPKYAQVLKQQQELQQKQNQIPQNQQHHHQNQPQMNQQHHHQNQPQMNQQQHMVQQKVLVTDPKTGKKMYVIKNVIDPKYAQTQKNIPQNQIQPQNQKKEPKQIQQTPPTNNKQTQQIEEEKKKLKEEKEKYQKYINALVKEYYEAKEYFKKNGSSFEKQLAKAREDLNILVHAKQKIDNNRHKEVKLNSLPKPITPEYIFGYTDKERMEKFKIVLTHLIKEKNDCEQKTNSILEKLKKLKRKELEKAKDAVKPKLDELKTKKENIIKLMDALKEKFKDKWTPAPEYKKVNEEEQIEKISYEGCKYGLSIKVGKTDYDKDKTSLVILLEVNRTKILKKEVQLKQLGDFNEEWKWEFSGDEWKNIPKTFLYVELYRQHTFSNDKKGSGKIDLNNIRRGTAIKNDCKIEIESKRVEPIINFIITPILPEGKKYYEKTVKEVIKITKIYQPFTGKQQVQLDNTDSKTTPPPKPVTGAAVEQNAKNQEKNNNNNTAKDGKEPVIDKSKFKPEELEDVDFIDNLNSLKVLEFKIKELEAKIKKIDGRTPREMLQKKVKMNCKKKQLEEGMGDGSISPKEYMDFMRIQLEHDQLLAMYLKQNNEEEKMKSVLQRVLLLKQEMEELKKYIK